MTRILKDGWERWRTLASVALLVASNPRSITSAFSSSSTTRIHQATRPSISYRSVPSISYRSSSSASSSFKPSSSSSSALHMVLTTPESIIEQASTQKLIDDLIDECVRTSARRPIMLQFDPSSNWIWKRWKGTIFAETWDSVIKRMAYAATVLFLCHSFPQVKTYLSGFGILWGQLLSVTTFTLTFFVNQSYALWRKCYELSRRLQGRLHDINLTLAAHAVRKPPTNPNEPSTYTSGSRQVLELVSRYVRLFNVLTYGSFTRSHRPILTPRGMRRLVERGLMTPREREVLVDAEIPATQRHTAVLLWIIRTYVEGREAGHFLGGAGFEEQILEKCHVARAQFGAIGDELQGRMPLAYAHIVQVLVDIILWMYPWMAYSSGMSPLIAVMGTGLLTVSYQGLFDLAKQFLDPYDNESYGKGEDPLVVDTLIAETNAGSVRWLNGLEQYPVAQQKVKDGDLSDMILPVRGYTVEEAEEIEVERIRKERESFERKAQREAEKQRLEDQAKQLREAAQAMIPAQAEEVALGEGLLSQLDIAVQPNPLVDKGLQLPRNTKAIKFDKGMSVADILAHMPSFGATIADDILPKGIPLAAEPVGAVRSFSMSAALSSAPTSRKSISSSASSHKPALPEVLPNGARSDSPVVTNGERRRPGGRPENPVAPPGGSPGSQMPSPPIGNDIGLDERSFEERPNEEEEELPALHADNRISDDTAEPVSSVLDEARAEQLETEAILNAPPAADSIEILERTDGMGAQSLNMTEDSDNLDMSNSDRPANGADTDSPSFSALSETSTEVNGDSHQTTEDIQVGDDERTIIEEALETESEKSDQLDEYDDDALAEKVVLTPEEEALAEQLETEAILNAPPAADNIEILEKKDDSSLLTVNATSEVDDLAILEMDQPLNNTTDIDGVVMPNGEVGDNAFSQATDDASYTSVDENSGITELYDPPVDGDGIFGE